MLTTILPCGTRVKVSDQIGNITDFNGDTYLVAFMVGDHYVTSEVPPNELLVIGASNGD